MSGVPDYSPPGLRTASGSVTPRPKQLARVDRPAPPGAPAPSGPAPGAPLPLGGPALAAASGSGPADGPPAPPADLAALLAQLAPLRDALPALTARLAALEAAAPGAASPAQFAADGAAAEASEFPPSQPAAAHSAGAAAHRASPAPPPVVPAPAAEPGYLDPRDWTAELPPLYVDCLPPASQRSVTLYRPRHDAADRSLTELNRLATRDEYRHLVCYGAYLATADAATAHALEALRQAHPPTADTEDAWRLLAAAAATREAAAAATANRISYIRRFKTVKTLNADDTVAERFVYDACFAVPDADPYASDVDALLYQLQGKRSDLALSAAAKAQAANAYKGRPNPRDPKPQPGDPADPKTPRPPRGAPKPRPPPPSEQEPLPPSDEPDAPRAGKGKGTKAR